MYTPNTIQIIADWAKRQPKITAAALVGSHARGTARPDSDIDILLLTLDPLFFRRDPHWIDTIDWPKIGAPPLRWQDEDYGVLWSRRLWLADNANDIELSFAPTSWAGTNPVDPGTFRVISDGCRILSDPTSLLHKLLLQCAR